MKISIEGVEEIAYFDIEKLRFYKQKIEMSEFDGSVVVRQEQRLKKLVLLITERCNLRCSYCFIENDSKTYCEQDNIFDCKKMKEYLYSILSNYPNGIEYFEFFGGEPLLNFQNIKKTVDIVEQVCREKKIKQPLFSIISNGTLLNRENVRYLNEKGFFVTISIDGNQKSHDENRYDKNHKGTYGVIKKKLQECTINHLSVEFSISDTMVNNYTKNYIVDCIENYIELNVSGIVSNVIVSQDMSDKFILQKNIFIQIVEEYTDFILKEMFSKNCRIFDYHINNVILAVLRHERMRPACTEGINSIVMDLEGNIKSCYLSKESLGKAFELCGANRNKYMYFMRPGDCFRCCARSLCQSWCREIDQGNVYLPRCEYTRTIAKKVIKKIFETRKSTLKYAIENLSRLHKN